MARGHFVPKGILISAASAAALGFLLAGGISCDLFETRTPTNPGTNRFACLSLDAPGNIFTNITQAYGRGDGLGCYLSTLDDAAFAFHADPTDSAAAPAQFTGWTTLVEARVAQNIASDSDADSFLLQLKLPFVLVAAQPEVETRRYPYEIKFRGTAISDTFFQGLAEITVRKNAGGQWLVGDWVDRRDPGGTTSLTWGYLRGSYRIGI